MDYEMKYKAVLKTATQWIKDGCTDKEKICLECVFPELRESEDERTRKEIINFILYKAGALIDEDTEHRYIAYLEKKEPQWKPSEEQMKSLRMAVDKLAKIDVAASVSLSIMYDNLKKLKEGQQ